jgi:hypothetical protein
MPQTGALRDRHLLGLSSAARSSSPNAICPPFPDDVKAEVALLADDTSSPSAGIRGGHDDGRE